MSIRKVRFGIVSESRDNIVICRWLLKNMLMGIQVIAWSGISYDHNTQIQPNDIPKIASIFERKIAEGMIVDFIIILTDSDGDKRIKSELQKKLESIDFPRPFILGVADKTLEDWLIIDMKTLNNTLGLVVSGMPRKGAQAKDLFESLLARSTRDPIEARAEIARHIDIDELSAKSSSFNDFRKTLENAVYKSHQTSHIQSKSKIKENAKLIAAFIRDPSKIIRRHRLKRF